MNEKLEQAVLYKNAKVMKSILADLIEMVSDDFMIGSEEAQSLILQTETFRVLNEETPLDFEYNIISIHKSVLGDILKNASFDIVLSDIDFFDPPGADKEMDRRIQAGFQKMIEEKRAAGLPIARWDDELRKAYLEWPDGRRQYI